MGKLFIFGIGGTGSRVLKALTFLLATGVDINATEVVPMLLDPDRANGDMNRTEVILKKYQNLRSYSEFNHNKFFKTPITTLSQLNKLNAQDGFRFELDDVQNELFKDFIGYSGLDDTNRAFVDLIFSDENLNADLELGFKGNPNIGSVVLNQFKDSTEFKTFASNFTPQDRIFIISSIFGGTGAAGFPLLLKNIRNANDDLPNHALLKKAKIGAITLLPYFGVAQDENSKIDKGTFMSKTKAALNYYAVNISGNKSLNALYYIGDKLTKDYENVEGALNQRNDAHFIEIAAALSLIDFMSLTDEQLEVEDAKAVQPIYKEYGAEEMTDPLSFQNLGVNTRQQIEKNLVYYRFFQFYMKHQFNKSVNDQDWSKRGNPKLDKQIKNHQTFFSDLESFNSFFEEWLKELSDNRRAFIPFNLGVGSSNLFEMVEGKAAQKSWNPLGAKNMSLYDDHLNSAEKKVGDLPISEKFMAVFYKATESLISKKYKL